MTGAPTIGIISGSGPEAGIDLWTKVVAQARRELGHGYRGDADAPRVVVISEPALGASMDLPDTRSEVWAALERTASEIAPLCDFYAIACNTLNCFAPQLTDLALGADVVSFANVVRDWAEREEIEAFGLLGARPVAELTEWSPYRNLAGSIEIEQPRSLEDLQILIADVKATGSADPDLRDRFVAIAERFSSERLVLACTELPLIACSVPGRELADVTDLVARDLVRRWAAGVL